MFDTIVYEVEYIFVNKASLYANTIAENLFLQVDEEGKRFVLFDEKVCYCICGTDTMQQDAFVVSKN